MLLIMAPAVMAQVSELLDVQRGLVQQLEQTLVDLAIRQEREVVEERMIQTFERHLESVEQQRRRQQAPD